MKLLPRLSFVIFASILALTCKDNKNQNEFIKPHNFIPVLEISQEAFGNWEVTGKILFFRLYENGSVELEYANDTKKFQMNQAARQKKKID